MFIEDITVEVRDESYQRVGQILPKDLVGFKAVLRFNNVGTWEITLPANHDVGDILRLPGSGIIVTGPDGVLISGPTISAQNTVTSENSNGDWIISGVDDSVILAERLAYPSPAVADVTAQTAAYDVRHTLASTAMYGYVEDNIGPYAHATRRIVNLDVAADAGLGSYVYPAARFDILGELLAGIASVDGLGFDIVQDGDILRFSVYQPVDRSGQIRMDVHNNTLASTEYAYEAHSLSRAIVAGQGDGLNRTFIEVSSTESVAAENLWNRRIERFVDQRNTDDLNELQQAGVEKLADGGMTLTSVDVTPSSDLTMVYGVDWNLGDKVTVVVDEQEVATVVTAVSMSIESDGIRIGATVGQPTGVDFESKVAKHTQNTTQRVNALERKEVPAITWNDTEGTYEFVMKGGNVTQQIGAEQLAYVKNNTGATLLNGRAVYPNGSTGANKLVAYAQANSEATSTQTFGVLTEDIANGGHGWVTTFGMVHDIDTSALTEGASVWLSPTVPGGLTSTKPVAPNHMVLIGFCVRSHAVNGSIFVKVQNGFELDELHDVLITSKTNGQVLVATANGWENKTLTPADIGAATAAHTHTLNDLSDVTVTSPTSGQAVVYNGSGWVNGQATSQSDVPTGSIVATVATTAPSGWLMCNGAAVSRTTYANLFGVIGTTYGAGDGSTTFNLPDLRSRVPVGSNTPINLGTATVTIATPGVVTKTAHKLATGQIVYFTSTGALPTGLNVNTRYWVNVIDANTFRLSTSLANALAGTYIATSGTQSGTHTLYGADYEMGRVNGEEQHTLTVAEMPSHSHTLKGNTAVGNYAEGVAFNNTNSPPYTSVLGVAVNNNGGSIAHNNLQPYQVVNYVIKFTSAFVSTDSELAARTGALETANATTNKSGLVPMIPSSIGIGSGSYSVSTDGAVTFSGASIIRFNGVFTSAYSFYRVVASIWTPTYQAVSLISRWSTNGVDDTTGYYYEQHYQNLGNTHAVGLGANVATNYVASIGTMACQMGMDVANPMQSYKTSFLTNYLYNGVNTFEVGTYGGFREAITSNDGFSLYLPSGTISGKLQVFAYRG